MLTDEDMCPHCKRSWYKKVSTRTDGAGRLYFDCECLNPKCKKRFDIEQWRYKEYDKRIRGLNDEDIDMATILIKQRNCPLCGKDVVEHESSELDQQSNIVSIIIHCSNSECSKAFYIPKPMYDLIKSSR